MRSENYPSDVTNEQWRLSEPLIPAYPEGWPRNTPLRDVIDATFYFLRRGYQWRDLPKGFPPRLTVSRNTGTLEDIQDILRERVRKQ